jgi:glycosyltransferase 2 family protein
MSPHGAMIRKLLPFAALSIGIAATVWLIAAARLTSILDSVAQVGWGIAAVVAVRAIMITINGVAWRLSLKKLVEVPYAVFPFVRWIREAIDVLLPVASIGGSLASARLLTFWRVSVAMALAGVFADVFLQTVAQALFASAGALLLARMVGLGTLLPQLLLGVAAAAVVLGGFYLLQRYGAARWIDRAMNALTVRTAWRVQRGEIGVQSAMDKIWRGRRLYLATALVIHVIAWASGTLEVWLTLHFMHWPVSLEPAIVLESLGASISSAAFFIPGSWGVQEGGYILIGHLLGVPAPLALSLSLVKRVPDLVLGAPGLLAWRIVEARHLLVARPETA